MEMGGEIKSEYLWAYKKMTDTPQHIKDLQLKLWLEKTPGERLYQTIIDLDAMRHALIDAKKNLGLPLGDLDPVGEYLKKKNKNQ
jgi:hypothetical protein